jgi:fucose permease
MSVILWSVPVSGAILLALYAVSAGAALFWPDADRRREAMKVMTLIGKFIVALAIALRSGH